MAPAVQVLIVEDDEIISGLIAVMLEKKGYHVAGKVITGEDAIMRAAETVPDIVLMDINLAGTLDGIAAARYIFSFFRIPIIFLTGQCDDDVLNRAKIAEPYGFILKPFTANDLTSNIEIALYNHNIRKKYFDKFATLDLKKIMPALEAVMVADIKGRVIFFNPYTLRLLDVNEPDVLMKFLRHVLILVNKLTGERIPDPALDVIREMIVINYELNTVLVTKTNKKRYVGVTARPMKNENNELLGIYVHVREKTLNEIKMASRT
ncbi:MAG: response regulator [Methanoregula sp.]|jgi:DNA-binding NarL/FixJ family response regulator